MKFRVVMPLVVAVLLWTALVVVGLMVRPLLPVDETRYLAVAWEMWRTGDYLVPHLNGIAYHHKPPLLFWLMTLGWDAFGVSEIWGRLVAPLFGLGALLLTARLAQHLFPKYPEVAGGAPLALIGTGFFALFASLTFFDLLLTFFTLMGLIGVWQAALGRAHWGWGLFAVALGLGILSKGPVQLLNLGTVPLLAPWWSPKRPTSWRLWYAEFIFAVLVGAVIALLWAGPAAMSGGSEFAYMLFVGQTTERVVEALWHERPWWWYLPVSFLLVFPWLWWPAFWRSLFVRGVEREAGVRFCLSMIVPVFIAFSVISGKQPHYLLPMIPVFALLLGRHVAAAATVGRFADDRWSRLPPLIGIAIPGLALIALALFPDQIGRLARTSDLPAPGMAGLAAGAVILAFALLIAFDRRSGPNFRMASYSCAVALTITAAEVAVFPTLRPRIDVAETAAFLAKIEAEHRPIANVADYHGQYNFTGRLTEPIVSVFAEDAVDWAKAHGDGVMIAYPEAIPADTPAPLFVHPYRGRLVVIWDAADVAATGRRILGENPPAG